MPTFSIKIIVNTLFLMLVVNPLSLAQSIDLNAKARQFMQDHNIRQAEEEYLRDIYHFGWRLVETKDVDGGQLLIMRVMDLMWGNGDENQALGLEVLALKENGNIVLFEELVDIPDTLTIQYQSGHGYVYQFKNKLDIKRALKMHLSGRNELSNAFTGWALDNGKSTYDPTPGRNWKLLNAELDLRALQRDEVHDIQAADLDSDFRAFFNGGHRVEIDVDGHPVLTLEVGPWGGSLFVLDSL